MKENKNLNGCWNEALFLQKESAMICVGERVEIEKGKTTRSDTLRVQVGGKGNWENLEEQVGRTVSTVS